MSEVDELLAQVHKLLKTLEQANKSIETANETIDIYKKLYEDLKGGCGGCFTPKDKEESTYFLAR